MIHTNNTKIDKHWQADNYPPFKDVSKPSDGSQQETVEESMTRLQNKTFKIEVKVTIFCVGLEEVIKVCKMTKFEVGIVNGMQNFNQ